MQIRKIWQMIFRKAVKVNDGEHLFRGGYGNGLYTVYTKIFSSNLYNPIIFIHTICIVHIMNNSISCHDTTSFPGHVKFHISDVATSNMWNVTCPGNEGGHEKLFHIMNT